MNEVQGLVRNRIHEGKFEEFERLAAKCMDSVRTKDSGTLQYDWSTRRVRVLEQR